MGILGYGYWIFPFALGILSWILVSANRESVVFRGVCAALLPFLLGSALHLILCKSAFTQGDVYTIIKELYAGGVAGETGGVLAGGLGMLLHQAVPGFERWFGVRPTVSPALRAAVFRKLRSRVRTTRIFSKPSSSAH